MYLTCREYEYDESSALLEDFKPALIIGYHGIQFAIDIEKTDVVSPNMMVLWEWDENDQPDKSWHLMGDTDEIESFFIFLSKLKDLCAMYGGCI